MTRRRPGALVAAVALVVAWCAGIVDAETYTVDPRRSAVQFSIRHLVSRVKGRFTEFSGHVVYDPDQPGQTRVSGTVQVHSIDTANPRRDRHLRSTDFFDAEQYPTITFQSSKAELDGEVLQVTGQLSMHGVTKEVVLPLEVLGIGTHPATGKGQAGFRSKFELKRSDYGVNRWERFLVVLGNVVEIEVRVEANAR